MTHKQSFAADILCVCIVVRTLLNWFHYEQAPEKMPTPLWDGGITIYRWSTQAIAFIIQLQSDDLEAVTFIPPDLAFQKKKKTSRVLFWDSFAMFIKQSGFFFVLGGLSVLKASFLVREITPRQFTGHQINFKLMSFQFGPATQQWPRGAVNNFTCKNPGLFAFSLKAIFWKESRREIILDVEWLLEVDALQIKKKKI